MTMAYIRDFYGVPAKRGAIVYFKGFRGKIVGSKNAYLRVKMEDFNIIKTLHPEEVRYGNWALTGEFGKVDREGLSAGDLDLLAKLENLDTVLIGCGSSYEDRKKELEKYASEQRGNDALLLAN